MGGSKLADSPIFGFIICGASCLFFLLVSSIVSLHLVPARAVSHWKFKNVCVSLVHAFITAVGSLLCFYVQPEMSQDLISTHNAWSHSLVCISWGYFLYDSLDMLLNYRKRETYELLGHHAVILVCFGIAVVFQVYVGYAVVALLVEVNSVFLHTRQLLRLSSVDKTGLVYRVNSLVNIGTFIPFRLVTLSWMTRWLVYNRQQVPLVAFTVGSLGMAIVMVMNVIYFFRLFHSDFIRKKVVVKQE